MQRILLGRMPLAVIAVVLPCLACATAQQATGAAGVTAASGPQTIDYTDLIGDDYGPGTYKYPTDQVYKPGSFDLTELQIVPTGDTVEFQVSVASRIEDPWDSKAWGGNGFSVQMVFIFIDTDHVVGSGVTEGLPGLNIRFKPEEAWDRVIILSPQGPARVNSEIETKCPQWKDRIIVPKLTRAQGKTIIGVIDAAQLGGPVRRSWGVQVAMQSNEGFPDKGDLLTRKVNEFEGQHRFGGGSDYNNDPHVIDILSDPPEAQKAILNAYNHETTTPKFEDLAVVPMIYGK